MIEMTKFEYFKRAFKFIIFSIIYSCPIYFKKLWGLIFGHSEKDITGQIALITGGGGGLGKAIAIELAKNKCNVVIADIDLKAAQEVVNDLRQFNIKAKAYKVDISKYSEVNNLAMNIENDLGPIDILINNAGLLTRGLFLETNPEAIENTINVNLLSYIWTVKVFLQGMIERRKGHIVAISSIAGLCGSPLGTIYTSSKYGVRGFMEALAYELKLNGYDFIKTTTIYPYFISTRKDLMDYLDKNNFSVLHYLEVYTPESVAKRITKSILKQEISVTIPSYIKPLLFLKMLQPFEVDVLLMNLLMESR